MKRNAFHLLFLLMALLTASVARAQTPGSWLLRAGAIHVAPQVTSGCLSAPDFSDGPDGCTKADVGSNTQPGGGISWIISTHFSLDIPFAAPFTHNIYGDGAMKGAGRIASIQSLPLTLFPQYRLFGSRSLLRPYIGLGVTYAYFFKPEGSNRLTAVTNPGGEPTTFTVDSKVMIAPQLGMSIRIYHRLFADLFYSQSKLRTRIHMSTGQQLETAIDPQIYGLSLGLSL